MLPLLPTGWAMSQSNGSPSSSNTATRLGSSSRKASLPALNSSMAPSRSYWPSWGWTSWVQIRSTAYWVALRTGPESMVADSKSSETMSPPKLWTFCRLKYQPKSDTVVGV